MRRANDGDDLTLTLTLGGAAVTVDAFYIEEDRSVGVWGGWALCAVNGVEVPACPFDLSSTQEVRAAMTQAGLPESVSFKDLDDAFEAAADAR